MRIKVGTYFYCFYLRSKFLKLITFLSLDTNSKYQVIFKKCNLTKWVTLKKKNTDTICQNSEVHVFTDLLQLNHALMMLIRVTVALVTA